MSDLKKYHGVIPAFYACYDEEGNISPERVRGLTRHLIGKGVNGLYVGGSSGECIYQSKETRNYFYLRLRASVYTVLFLLVIISCLLLAVFGNKISVFVEMNVPVLEKAVELHTQQINELKKAQ